MNEDKLVPKRRFKEFQNSEAWEQRKLGDIGKTFTGLSGKTKKDFGHGDAEFVTYLNVFNNILSNIKQTENVEVDEKQNEIQYGDIFFTTSSETSEEVGMSSVWLDNRPDVYLNSFCFGYRTIEKTNPHYMAYMLRSPEVRKEFQILAQGISRYNISKNRVMDIPIFMPEIEEQEKIGTFFLDLDKLITLHQRKLNKLKETKLAYLSEMFPKEGEKYPKLRFDGFTEAWEQRKLREVASFSKGRGYSKNDLREEGTPIILYGNLYTNYKTVINEVNIFTIDKPNSVYSLGNEVVVPSSGESADDIARASAIANKGIILGGDLNIIHSNSNIDSIFLALLISNGERKIELATKAQGKSVVHLYNKDLEELNLIYPTKEEQTRISNFFSSIDNLVTLHQRM